jgi:hypothetical protein
LSCQRRPQPVSTHHRTFSVGGEIPGAGKKRTPVGATCAPTGVTGRVGPVRTAEPPPRRGSGLITATESATPQAVSQSLIKTQGGGRMVAPRR